MALSEFDRSLLERCLNRETRSWENFVDRFLGLVLHVVNHTANSRGIRLMEADREDLVSAVFLAIVQDDFSALKNFRGKSSLATYLTVVARRVVVRELLRRTPMTTQESYEEVAAGGAEFESRIEDREEIERLLSTLPDDEAEVVRLYHLEGKSYHEISSDIGMPENSVGPLLSRARNRLRAAGQTS